MENPLRVFIFRLCILLGKTKRELLSSMDSAELSEWLAYSQIEPLPNPFWIGANICHVIANCHSDGKKKFALSDFMPRVQATRRQTELEMRAALATFARRIS